MTLDEKSIDMHKKWRGKLDVASRSKVDSKEALAIAYTPGVAAPCREIAEDEEELKEVLSRMSKK